ncbi:hypothetical protein [Trinickia sp. Y13]|uniref:hypothetical protein n=1 Tax=Trinickia sp. Y13 TaxID=2917807 RepID=UPI0024068953|nr:hypothetical protein [Trinickia sp. Y13]MDG0025948.1 hypothetical protein [Trinickia sp. Y13]
MVDALKRKVNGLLHRDRLKLTEAGYVVADRLDILDWHDAVALLVEHVANGKIPAIVEPEINDWHGNVIAQIDPDKSTVAMSDLLAWLDTRSLPAGSRAESVEQNSQELREQVSELEAKISELANELASANARIDALEADRSEGKSRSKMLQVIGAIAIDAYRVDIHAQRMTNFGDMLSSIQTVGADVKEDALRSYLKDAADLIGKPANR